MAGILFDFNGTMFFDELFQEESWKQFLMEKTGRTVTDQEFRDYVHGRNADFSLPYFLGRPLSRAEIESLEEEKEAIYRKLCLDSTAFRLAHISRPAGRPQCPYYDCNRFGMEQREVLF